MRVGLHRFGLTPGVSVNPPINNAPIYFAGGFNPRWFSYICPRLMCRALTGLTFPNSIFLLPYSIFKNAQCNSPSLKGELHNLNTDEHLLHDTPLPLGLGCVTSCAVERKHKTSGIDPALPTTNYQLPTTNYQYIRRSSKSEGGLPTTTKAARNIERPLHYMVGYISTGG